MMDIVIKNQYKNNSHRNQVFFNLSEDELAEIKKEICLGNPSYIDFVIDFNDAFLLNNLFLNLPEEGLDEVKRKVYDDYISLKILEQIKSKGYEIEGRCKHIDLSKNYHTIMSHDSELELFELIESNEVKYQLIKLSRATGKFTRIHFFLGLIEDPILQEVVNKNFFVTGSPIMMAYSSRSDLITRVINEEKSLEDGKDLMAFYKDNVKEKEYNESN